LYRRRIDPVPSRTRPYGQAAVVSALVEAATELFARHGPGAVSLRDVAREADVNLGLIHRYVGGKQDLLGLVLAGRPGMPPSDAPEPRSTGEVVDLLLGLISADATHNRVLARAILDGFDVPRGPEGFPLIARSATALRAEVPAPDADVRVAMLAAAALGWQVIGPLLLEAVGQDHLSPEELASTLRPALLAFLTAAPA
jgi:AcrR family transcriptional regulator